MIHRLQHYDPMRQEFGERQASVLMDTMGNMLDEKFNEFRGEIRQEMRILLHDQLEMSRELFASKKDLADLRGEMKADISGLRSEFKTDIASLESRMTWKMFLFWTGQSALLLGILLKLFWS